MFTRIINKEEENTNYSIQDLINILKENPAINECGAIFTFEGIVRGKEADVDVDKLLLKTGDINKTEEELEQIAINIKDKYNVKDIAVVHYIGEFDISDDLFLVAISGAHRGETRDALKELIEKVKFELDFEKEEFSNKGSKVILSGG